MAGFQTHITTSTVLGIGYAGAGMMFDVPVDSALVAGGMCSIGGMLPDVDSDSGVPIRETMAFSAAVIPMLLISRFQHLNLTHEQMVLAGGALYLLIRFGLSRALKKYTVHRGMFHSIPAMLIFAGIGFLLCGCHDLTLRLYKAGALMLGVASHLLLDEWYSIEWKKGRFRLKKSFGTAMKFWGNDLWGNVSVYAKLIIVLAMILSEPVLMDRIGAPVHDGLYQTANGLIKGEGHEQALSVQTASQADPHDHTLHR